MNDPLYRELLMDFWDNPKNYGIIKKPDIDVTKYNPLCGDKVRIMVKLNNNKIKEISYTCKSCVVAKALTSQLTIIAKGMKIKNFLKIKPEKFLSSIDIGFSPIRIKCALLGYSALREALINKRIR